MKKGLRSLVLAGVMALAGNAASAQYTFTQATDTFQFLGNPVVLSGPTWDSETYNSAIGFPLTVLGTTYDSMAVEANGSIILYQGPLTGPEVFSEQDTLDALICFGEWISGSGTGDLVSRGNNASPISYELTGTAPLRIAKVEWKNAGFFSDPNTVDSISFQAWIYEGSGDIEYHYGPGRIAPLLYASTIPGPTVGIAPYAPSTFELFNGYYLTGDSASPSMVSAYSQITGTPVENTVYRFSSVITGVKEQQAVSVNAYPNPATDRVTVTMNLQGKAVISILDITGRAMMQQEVNGAGSSKTSFDVSLLTPGVYFVNVTGAVNTAKKIVVR